MILKQSIKFQVDWNQQQGKVSKEGSLVLIHPFDLIPQVQRKKGIDAACRVASQLISDKYHRLLEDAKVKPK